MLTDSIFTTIQVNLDVNYSYLALRLERSASFASLIRLYVNSRISFVFALMKCSYAAFGEQNKIDNDRKCQLVYEFSIILISLCSNDRFTYVFKISPRILL